MAIKTHLNGSFLHNRIGQQYTIELYPKLIWKLHDSPTQERKLILDNKTFLKEWILFALRKVQEIHHKSILLGCLYRLPLLSGLSIFQLFASLLLQYAKLCNYTRFSPAKMFRFVGLRVRTKSLARSIHLLVLGLDTKSKLCQLKVTYWPR